MNRSRRNERRKSYRIQLDGAYAQCTSPRSAGTYTVRDISHGGVALEGSPLIPSGSRVGLRLVIPGHEPLELGGTVLRAALGPRRTGQTAVSFGRLGVDEEDQIGNIILDTIAAGRGPTCLIASRSAGERAEIASGLTAIGCRVVEAVTPVDAIRHLEGEEHVDTIVLGSSVGDYTGVEFASFVAGAYPSIRRVLATRPAGRRRVLASIVADVTLERPWLRTNLREAVGLPSPRNRIAR